jgi:hypothetical protein
MKGLDAEYLLFALTCYPTTTIIALQGQFKSYLPKRGTVTTINGAALYPGNGITSRHRVV